MKLFGRKKSDQNEDFEAFKAAVRWFIKPSWNIEFDQEKQLKLSETFKKTFLKLVSLIGKARTTHLTINAQEYLLLAWDTNDGQIAGWLNKLEKSDANNCDLIKEHELLLQNIGGIQESFNGPEDAFTNNQNFMFTGSECFRGIGDYNDYYAMSCEAAGLAEMDYQNLIVFACEANGALTLHEPLTKRVLLFSHDHSYDHVEFLVDQPEYTFHRFKGVNTFVDFVEVLSEQWNSIVKSPHIHL